MNHLRIWVHGFIEIQNFTKQEFVAFIDLFYMVAYFCHHLSDNNVDLSDLYVDLSFIYVVLSDQYVDFSEEYHHN